MDQRVRSLNQAIQSHDRDLYVRRESHGINVYRKGTAFDYFDLDGFRLLYSRPNPKFILALTDNWNVTGKPVDWGIEPVIQRLKAIDMQGDFNEVTTLMDQMEKDEEQKIISKRSKFEDMAKEMRPVFAKAFDGVNTSTLAKTDKRRIAHGNR